jgi:predicted regulator of Ras-like GTPase activity (Roadblock/LC7/MglB family)
VSFRLILHELLATTSGAVAAIFLDFEGETVDLVCDRDLSDHDLRIVGAYQGIFLGKLRDLCEKTRIGAPRRFKIEFQSTTILACDLKEGYYLVLLLDHRGNEGLAWEKLAATQQRILAEM